MYVAFNVAFMFFFAVYIFFSRLSRNPSCCLFVNFGCPIFLSAHRNYIVYIETIYIVCTF